MQYQLYVIIIILRHLNCTILQESIKLIENSIKCSIPFHLLSLIATIIWSSDYIIEIKELKRIRKQFQYKYGTSTKFDMKCKNNHNGCLNHLVVNRLYPNQQQPNEQQIQYIIDEIKNECCVVHSNLDNEQHQNHLKDLVKRSDVTKQNEENLTIPTSEILLEYSNNKENQSRNDVEGIMTDRDACKSWQAYYLGAPHNNDNIVSINDYKKKDY